MRTHKHEMIRFARSEEGTGVWYKYNNKNKWNKTFSPTWDEDAVYIVDNKYAKLRKENIDTGRPIQVSDETGKWVTLKHELNFNHDLRFYRVEPKQVVTEQIYYYKWERMYAFGVIEETKFMTDEWVKKSNFNEENTWRKIESSKRIWEDLDEKVSTYNGLDRP